MLLQTVSMQTGDIQGDRQQIESRHSVDRQPIAGSRRYTAGRQQTSRKPAAISQTETRQTADNRQKTDRQHIKSRQSVYRHFFRHTCRQMHTYNIHTAYSRLALSRNTYSI